MPEIDLFADDEHPMWVEVVFPAKPPHLGVWRDSRQVWDCKRCGAIVRDRARHHFWHGAVDSNTTTQLPGGGPDA